MLIRVLASVLFFRVLMGGVTEKYQSALPRRVDAAATHKELQGEDT